MSENEPEPASYLDWSQRFMVNPFRKEDIKDIKDEKSKDINEDQINIDPNYIP